MKLIQSGLVLLVAYIATSPLMAENYPPQYSEAVSSYQSGNYEKSLETIRSVFDDYKEMPEFRLLAAANYYHLGNSSSALAHLEYCEKDHPERVDVKLMMAGIQRESRMFTSALETVRRGLQVAPGDMRLLLEEVKIHYRRGSMGIAKKKNMEILAKDPNNFQAVSYEGLFFLKGGKFEAAEFRFRQALRLPHRPGFERAGILNNLAYSLEKQMEALKAPGDAARKETLRKEAEDLYRKAMKEDANLSIARENYKRFVS